MCFENKVVFITGANGGLAKSFIEALLKRECKKNILYSKRFRKISWIKKIIIKNRDF